MSEGPMPPRDERTKAEKMRAVANAPSAAPAERQFAKQWLADHHEPLTARPQYRTPPMPPTGYPRSSATGRRPDADSWDPYRPGGGWTPPPRNSSRPMSDDEKRRRDEREEAAHRRERDAQAARERGFANRDAFGRRPSADNEFYDAFLSGFREEAARSPFFGARPVEPPFTGDPRWSSSTPETERIRREEARREQEARRRQDARDRLDAQRAARDYREQAKAERKGPRIDHDESGNPIYRRR